MVKNLSKTFPDLSQIIYHILQWPRPIHDFLSNPQNNAALKSVHQLRSVQRSCLAMPYPSLLTGCINNNTLPSQLRSLCCVVHCYGYQKEILDLILSSKPLLAFFSKPRFLFSFYKALLSASIFILP